MAEALSRVIQTDVVVTACQKRVEKQRINITLEVPAIHLDAEFIAQHQCYRQGIVFFVIGPVLLSAEDHLLQRYKIFIGDTQRHIGQDLHPLFHPHLTVSVIDGSAIIAVIHRNHLMDGRESLTLAEQTHIGHQLTCLALVPALILDIAEQVGNAIAHQMYRMEHGTPQRREAEETNGQHDQDHKGHIRISAS